MTTSVTTTAGANLDKLREIGKSIHAAIAPAVAVYGDVQAAVAVLDGDENGPGLRAQQTNAREAIAVTLANLATTGNWSRAEVNGGVAAALGKGVSNAETPKAVATFLAEVKLAMYPGVREHVGALIDLRNLACDEEDMLRSVDKEMPAPIRKAFKRRYHLMVTMFREYTKEDGYRFSGVSDVVSFAELNDPDIDAAKVSKEVNTMLANLTVILSNFPDEGIRSAMDALAEVSKDTLIAARQPIIDAAARASAAVRLAPLPPTVQAVADIVQAAKAANVIAPQGVDAAFAELLGDLNADVPAHPMALAALLTGAA